MGNKKLNSEERKILTLASLGGMLEFYDFVIYGIFSVYFAKQFFPSNDPVMSIIESYVVFLLGYIARPIGGIIFSHIGDDKGRKHVLIITVGLMGLSSFGIGLLPTHSTIGIFAPITLLVLRLIQGLALGGELPSTYVYVAESMSSRHGTSFGVTMFGVNSGLLIGVLVNDVLSMIMSSQEIARFGWRIPFIIGGMLCLVSYKIRKSLHETTAFKQIEDKPTFPLLFLLRYHLPQVIIGILTTSIMSVLVVGAIIFMPTYLQNILKIDSKLVGHVMLCAMIINVIGIFVCGRIADYIHPRQIMKFLLIMSFIFIPISYYLIGNGWVYLGANILALLEGISAMIVPFLLTQLFEAKIRLSGVAISYNIGFTIFGGMTPMMISAIIEAHGNPVLTPMVYLLVVTLLATCGTIYSSSLNKRHKQ